MAQWDPFRQLEALRREIDRVFEDVGWGMPPLVRSPFAPGRPSAPHPLVNIYDGGEALLVEALAPGVEPTSFELTVLGKTLTIAGEKRAPAGEVTPEAFHRQERPVGKFARTVELPVEVNEAGVTASYTNGLLVITLPKAEKARPRQISVQVS
jgi:HSP20 family protein